VDWNSLTLTVLAVFGLLSLVVTLLVQLIKQLPELIRAVREMLSALKSDSEGDESTTGAGESERPARQEVGGEPGQERD
jgi:Sec-independent protein translocase protein TatA